jgi:predicted phosphodiesterase
MSRSVALLADVHGNLVALHAVLADAAAAGADELVVIGDHVNRGPASAAVVDLLRARGAHLLRGNHEADYVAAYGTPAMPPAWTSGWGSGSFRWTMEGLGPARRAFLVGLPDRLWLDEATVAAHGSPLGVRGAVRADTPDARLAELLPAPPEPPVQLAFVGHTHRPLVRDVAAGLGGQGRPACRFVNVGAVGNPLDGSPRASYILATPGPTGAPGDWRLEPRRVAYDVEAAIAAFDGGMRAVDPEFSELIVRELRTGHPYLGPALRATEGLAQEAISAAIRRFLVTTP